MNFQREILTALREIILGIERREHGFIQKAKERLIELEKTLDEQDRAFHEENPT